MPQHIKTSKTLVITNIKRLILISSLVISMPMALNGCSAIGKGVDAVGSGVVAVAEGVQKVTADVKVNKIDNENFELQISFNEPVKSLESWAMRIEARELCPDGYVYENRNVVKSSQFNEYDADCVSSANCTYKLNWRIKCQDVPEEPFSFFGKT